MNIIDLGAMLIMDAATVVIAYFMLSIFYGKRTSKLPILLLSFLAYYIGVVVAHIILEPPVSLVTVNLVAMFLFSFHFQMPQIALAEKMSPFVYRALVAAFCIIFMAGLEYVGLAIYQSCVSAGIVPDSTFLRLGFEKILMLGIIQIILRFKNLRQGYLVSTRLGLLIAIVPLASAFLIVTWNTPEVVGWKDVVGACLLMLINIVVFVLYDQLSSMFYEKVKSLAATKDAEYLASYVDTVNSYQQKIGRILHDTKQQFAVLHSYVQHSENDTALNYMEQINQELSSAKLIAHSGNLAFDIPLNGLLGLAQAKGIAVDLKMQIPEHVDIDRFDLNSVLSNLIMNAIEASEKLPPEQRQMEVIIFAAHNNLIIKVVNRYNGKVTHHNGKLQTLKTDTMLHGLGLANIEDIVVGKWHGTFDSSHTETEFTARVVFSFV